MASRHFIALSLVACCALPLAGCLTTSPRMHALAGAIQDEVPELELEPIRGGTLGRMSLGLARGVARMVLDEEEEEQALDVFRGVRKVEFAHFDASNHEQVTFPRRLLGGLERKGWETLARYREDDQLAWVMIRLRSDDLRRVMVVHLDGSELMMVRVGGRLDRVLAAALTYSRNEVFDGEEDPFFDDWTD